MGNFNKEGETKFWGSFHKGGRGSFSETFYKWL
jgi:hypothetical protein